MNTGKLNRRITISVPGTMSVDGLGGFTEGAKTSSTTWCSAKRLSMQESLLYGLETVTSSYRFKFQYYSALEITKNYELTFETRKFRIVSIENIDEAKNEIVVIANERM